MLTNKVQKIKERDYKIGYIYFDSIQNKLFLLYKHNNTIGCEVLYLNQNSDEFPEFLFIFRKTLFEENSAEFIEFNEINNIFFVKFASFFKIYDISGTSFNIAIKPLDFYQMKHSSHLILIFNKALITQYPSLPFKVYNYKGEFLNNFDLILKKNIGIELLDVFETFLLLKQFHDELIIIDLFDGSYEETQDFVTPKNLDFYKNKKGINLIICFYAFGIQIWNFRGNLIIDLNFFILNEELYHLEKNLGLIVTGIIHKNKLFNKNYGLLLIDLNDFNQRMEVSIEKNQDFKEIFCTEFGNVFFWEGNNSIMRKLCLIKKD